MNTPEDVTIRRSGVLIGVSSPLLGIILAACQDTRLRDYEDNYIKVSGKFPNGVSHPENGSILFVLKPPALTITQKSYPIQWKPFRVGTNVQKDSPNSFNTFWGIGQSDEPQTRRAWTWRLLNVDTTKPLTLGFEWIRWNLKRPTRDGQEIPPEQLLPSSTPSFL